MLAEVDIVLLEEEAVTVTYEEERFFGKLVWHGNPTVQCYKRAFLALIDHGTNVRPVKRLLTDTRKQGVISPDMRKWFETEALPKGRGAGLTKVATITDANVFKRYYLNLLLRVVNKSGLVYRLVGDEAEGERFLFQD